jgi:hypothetical protein
VPEAFFRSSRKSGVSSPPATVDTTEVIPEGVSRPDGVCIPSVGGASGASASDSDSDSDSDSSPVVKQMTLTNSK